MSDKERGCAALKLAFETCSAALDALKDPNTKVQTPKDVAEVSLDTRLTDYASLLSLLYQNSTKLAIALKPSSLAYSAAIAVAKDIATQADALASCAWSINDACDGRTLACEARCTAEDVLGALKSLLAVYTSDAHGQGSGSTSEAGGPYLYMTGVVHDTIDRARGISRTNQEAVRKRWGGVIGGMSDCEKEVQEMVEEENEAEAEDLDGLSGSDETDGWEQSCNAPRGDAHASQEELERLKTVHSLFKFIHALVKRVDLIILRPSSLTTPPPPKTLDKLLSSGDTLLKASDDLVHALYIPQTPAAVAGKSKDLVVLVDEIRTEIMSIDLVTEGQGDNNAITNLSRQTASSSLKLDAQHDDALMTKERKWFATCFAQIFKTATNLAKYETPRMLGEI